MEVFIKKQNIEAVINTKGAELFSLKKDGKNFSGLWVSPDGKRQLKTVFKEVPMTKIEKENYENKMDQLNYENYDC